MPPAGLGAPCSNDSDCSGGLCISERTAGWPSGFCSAKCDPSQPTCQGMGKCFDTGEKEGLCVLPCAPGGNECRNAYECGDIMGDGSLHLCVPACTSNDQCPALGTCEPNVRLCVTPEADCGNGLDDDGDGLVDCEDPSGCQGSPACAAGATLTGRACTANTDCAAAGGDPACLTEADTGFPGGACSEFCDLTAKDCASAGAVCIDRKLPSGRGMCFASCTTAADCPTAGYKCADEGNGKMACLPACTADTQCSNFCNLDSGLCAPTDENCTDKLDNDVDGKTDCDDRDCAAACGMSINPN